MTNTYYIDTKMGGRLSPFKSVWPTIADDAFIFHGAQVVGDVEIGEQSSVWHNTVIRGDVNYIRIGKRSNIQDGSVIHVTTHKYPTIIGDDVLVAHKAMLHGCKLCDTSFVGIGAIVMDNTIIESDGMLAAGALLTPGKTIKKGELWAGSPAKFLRMLTHTEIEKNREMANHYYLLAKQHERDILGQGDHDPYP